MYTKKWLAAFGALICTLPLLMAPSGGLPSRPKFQTVSVGSGAISASTGSINISNTASYAATVLQNAGTAKGYFCLTISAGACVTGSAVNDVSLISAGPLRFSSNGGSSTAMSISGAGLVNINNADSLTVAGVSVSPASTTSTGTVVGCTTSPTVPIHFNKVGNMATLSFDTGISCTSNSTSFNLTGAIPAGFIPARTTNCVVAVQDNGVYSAGMMAFSSSTLVFQTNSSTTLWTNTGTKGVNALGATCSYNLN